MRFSAAILSRFRKKIVTKDGCWNWIGSKSSTGYGHMKIDGRKEISSHRMAYLLFHGEIPASLHVLHTCDNRNCVNPEHLFVGTNYDNVQDKKSKGRQPRGEMFPHTKLKEKEIQFILYLNRMGISQTLIGKMFRRRQGHMSDIISRRWWQHIVDDFPPVGAALAWRNGTEDLPLIIT